MAASLLFSTPGEEQGLPMPPVCPPRSLAVRLRHVPVPQADTRPSLLPAIKPVARMDAALGPPGTEFARPAAWTRSARTSATRCGASARPPASPRRGGHASRWESAPTARSSASSTPSLLRPLPLGEPERLVRVSQTWKGESAAVYSPQNFLDVQAAARSFESLAVYD